MYRRKTSLHPANVLNVITTVASIQFSVLCLNLDAAISITSFETLKRILLYSFQCFKACEVGYTCINDVCPNKTSD